MRKNLIRKNNDMEIEEKSSGKKSPQHNSSVNSNNSISAFDLVIEGEKLLN